jgi:MFS family permease
VSPLSWRNRTLWVLGGTSLLTDASSEMILPFLPLFLTEHLGASAVWVGAVDGAAQAVAALLQGWSGRRADRSGRHRAWVLAGYALSSVVRPWMGLAGSAAQVLAVRVTDRVGKGMRSSPRDALLAAGVAPDARGAVFGVHRAMDHAGAVIGPALALLVLQLRPGDLRSVFLASAFPAALAMLTLAVGLPGTARVPAPEHPAPPAAAGPQERPPWLAPLALLTLGRAPEGFLLLAAAGPDPAALPWLWMGLNAVQALGSGPLGRWSDRVGRRAMVLSGWAGLAALQLAFAVAEAPAGRVALFLAYGLHRAWTEGAEKAWIADLAPPDARATAFGRYHRLTGLLALPAGLGFGTAWSAWGPGSAFGIAAAVAAGAALWLAAATRPAR